MSILDIENLDFTYGEETLFKGASMRLFEGEHAVLVGPNGSGKSTLMRLMEGSLTPDKGTLNWQGKKTVGYLDQYQTLDESEKVRNYLYSVFLDLFDKERHMEALYEKLGEADAKEQERMLNHAARIGEELIDKNFYAIKSKVGSIIHGLGLSSAILDDPIRTLSSGMRAKVILAKLLLEESDVLLLDEPTNFLDIKHIEWLGKFLNDYEKTFIVVSHHEEFLKTTARTVLSLENMDIVRYKGDYAFYQNERKLREEQHEKAFEEQQKFIKRTETFIQKNITRAKTSTRAKSRRKMLNKMNRLAPPAQEKTYTFRFPAGKPSGKDVLSVKNLEIGYGESLVEPLDLDILKNEKVVITGKNGIGKSTLLKTLLGETGKLNGAIRWSDTVKISYFEQDSTLPSHLTPFEIVHDAYPRFTKKDIMSLLAAHGIDYDIAHRPIKTLSGGEKAKTRLALLRHQKSNVLICDEPTNHLDKNAKAALKEALQEYRGTLILVSHEEAFYNDLCDYEISLYSV